MRQRVVLTIVAAGISVAALTACGNSAGSSGSTPAGPAGVPAQTPLSMPLPETYGQAWDNASGCWTDFAAEKSQIVAKTPTQLCRERDAAEPAGTFYKLFINGTGSGQWLKTVGTKPDGYSYWEFQDQAWYRQTTDGTGAIQVKLHYQNGSSAYVDVATALDRYPTSITADMVATEDKDQNAVDTAEITRLGTDPRAPSVAQAERTAVTADAQAWDQLTQTITQRYQQAVQATQAQQTVPPMDTQGNALGLQALTDLAASRDAQTRMWAKPDCTFDNKVMDGCGD
jgi:hypothetical protein